MQRRSNISFFLQTEADIPVGDISLANDTYIGAYVLSAICRVGESGEWQRWLSVGSPVECRSPVANIVSILSCLRVRGLRRGIRGPRTGYSNYSGRVRGERLDFHCENIHGYKRHTLFSLSRWAFTFLIQITQISVPLRLEDFMYYNSFLFNKC